MPFRFQVCLLAFALMATACSATPPTTITAPPTTLATTTTTSSTTTTTLPPTTTTIPLPTSPINGLPVTDASLLDRRVMAVKIDNHQNARPQSGLQEADAVIELIVEGGFTRFIALFHDADSTYLGPTRSGRPSDVSLVRPLGATFTISGAQQWVIRELQAAGIPLFVDVRPGQYRISSRRAPHNLYADTTKLRKLADKRGFKNDPPKPLFDFGPMIALGEAATDIKLSFSSATEARWKYENGRYYRWTNGKKHNWVAKDGTKEQLAFDTLVVIVANQYTAKPPSGQSGRSLPAMDTVGKGKVYLFSGGRVVEGRWAKKSVKAAFIFTTADGSIFPVPPGVPWISVFPDHRKISW